MNTDKEALQAVVAALEKAAERIGYEDYIGTCGDCSGRKRCSCLAEHNEFMKVLEDALTHPDIQSLRATPND